MSVEERELAADSLKAEIAAENDPTAKLSKLRELRRLLVVADQSDTAPFLRYRNDPVGFCENVLGEQLWSVQRQILESVRDNKYTTVRSCHASGKSFTAARVVCWWLSCHPVGEAFAVTTAPTYPQVKAILWREIHRAHKKAGLPGRLNLTEWLIGDELIAFGRKPADYDEDAFQGIHARAVLAVLDEAGGIPESLWDATETILTSHRCRQLAIGNPDDPTAYFHKTHEPDSGYEVIKIRAFDTPNFTGEDVPEVVRESLIDPEWVEDKKRKWGEDSPLYVSKVLAEFPEDTGDNLFPLNQVNRASERVLVPDNPVELGVDVARMGDDETVIVVRKGPVARIHGIYSKEDTMRITGRIIQAAHEHRASVIKVDEIGVGAGVVDRLKEQGYPVWGLNAGRSPADPNPKRDEEAKQRFHNARAQWYWELRERFESGQIDIHDDDTLKSQLTNLKYKPTSTGKIQVESKDDMKSRGLSSPDRADALAIAFAGEQVTGKKKGKLRKVRQW